MKEYKEPNEESKFEEPDMAGVYSARDFLTWPVGYLVELIRGKIYKTSPTVSHQEVLGNLFYQFHNFFRDKKSCNVFISPLDVYLIKPGEDWRETKNIVEPDLLVVCDSGKIKGRGIIGPPDFVLEVLSPSSKKKDFKLKKELYNEYGIQEYWIVDPEKEKFFTFIANEGESGWKECAYLKREKVSPVLFPGLEICWV